MAGGEQGVVHRSELLGILVADHDASRQGDEVLELRRVVPHRGSAFGHVDLAQREGEEGDVPVGPVGQPGQEVLMGVAGEGAAVVPSDGKWLHSLFNT